MSLCLRSKGLADFVIPGDPTIHPGCDPLDSACIARALTEQGSQLCAVPGQRDSFGNLVVCYGQPGYDAYVQQFSDLYRAQIAAGPQPVYMLPNGQPATSMEQYRAAWSTPGVVWGSPVAEVIQNATAAVKKAQADPTNPNAQAEAKRAMEDAAARSQVPTNNTGQRESSATMYWVAGGIAVALLVFVAVNR